MSEPMEPVGQSDSASSVPSRVLIEGQAKSIAELHDVAKHLMSMLTVGDLLVLTGELGAGKTTFTRGLAEAFGVQETVSSPTFILARVHDTATGVPLIHLDAYRLSSAYELDDLGLDYHASITVAEWGKGLLEHEYESWLELVLERIPDAASPVDTADDEVVEEPRNYRLIGYGARWEETHVDSGN